MAYGVLARPHSARAQTGAAQRAALTRTTRLQRFLRQPKTLLTLIFLPLLLVAGKEQSWPAVLPHVLSAVAGAGTVDLLVACLMGRNWFWPSGALLSGLIAAFVLGTETPWTVTFAVGAIATASKHVFEYRRVHIFNPAGLALLVSIPLFATDQNWWGALPDLPGVWLLLLLAGGIIVVDRINKFPLVLSFLAAYFGLFWLAGLTNPAHAAEMFRAPFLHAALFLAFFMLTDPPTSPGRHVDQVWIGALVAGVSGAAQLLGAGQSYLLIGLLAGNIALVGRRWADVALRPPARI